MTHSSAYITLYPRSNYPTLSTLLVLDSSSLRNHYLIPQDLDSTETLGCLGDVRGICSGTVVVPSCMVIQLATHALRHLPCFSIVWLVELATDSPSCLRESIWRRERARKLIMSKRIHVDGARFRSTYTYKPQPPSQHLITSHSPTRPTSASVPPHKQAAHPSPRDPNSPNTPSHPAHQTPADQTHSP
jgi:hypothetical protein